MKIQKSKISSKDPSSRGGSSHSERYGPGFDPVSAERDMRVLNIQVDSDAISRMRDLGMVKAWEIGSKVAQTIRERNPKQVASAFSVARVPESHESRKVEELDQLAHREKEEVDHAFVTNVFRHLYNRDGCIAPNVRAEVIRLLQLFKIQYARDPQKFILQMMGKKTTTKAEDAAHLTAHHIVLKSRYVNQKDFSEIIKRLNSRASDLHIEYMFDVIGTHKEIGGKEYFLLDLWAFLDLLKHAVEDNRRSFDFKTSKIANDVEFWNQKRAKTPNQPNRVSKSVEFAPAPAAPAAASTASDVPTLLGGTSAATRASSRPRRQRESTEDASRPSSLSTRDTFAEVLGVPHRPHTGEHKSGRCVKGAFARDVAVAFSVPEALSSPVRPKSAKPDCHKMKGFNFGYEYSINLGRVDLKDTVDPGAIERVMNEGQGVCHAIYGRSMSETKDNGPPTVRKQRSSSSGRLTRAMLTKDSVAELFSAPSYGV